ncbi:MAG: hypothetical protein K8R02_08740 [Anaerohalosphaeraceae bacterium]|nr:hypothetical protein [Anaerohalosphaeraceae bacterium]
MKRITAFLVPLTVLVVFVCGCQEQAQSPSATSRHNRLVGNENLRLQNELQSCQATIENQKRLLAKCKQEKKKIQSEASTTADFLLKTLPEETMAKNARLTAENEKLLKRIAELKKSSRSREVSQ